MVRSLVTATILLLASCSGEQVPGPPAVQVKARLSAERPRTDPLVSRTLAIPETSRTETSELPVKYLSDLPVDPSWRLSSSQRNQLARLVARAYVVSIEEYKQDYILDTQTRIWRLIASNYVGADRLVSEGGVFLGKLTKFLLGADSGGT